MYAPIHQIVPGISPYDAISNEAFIIRDMLRSEGIASEIYAHHIHPQVQSEVKSFFSHSSDLDTGRLIYHYSIGDEILPKLCYKRLQVVLRYHNVTPKEFFSFEREPSIYKACQLGKLGLSILPQICRYAIAASHFNAIDLHQVGIEQVMTCPILRDFNALTLEESDQSITPIIQQSSSKWLLFVGRFVPNKAQEDLMLLLKLYKEIIQKPLKLILVGSFYSPEYKQQILSYAARLGLSFSFSLTDVADSDIYILSSCTDAQLATLYRSASCFVSMSEHEGFCVPLVEAMTFNLPILAKSCAAIPETAGAGALYFQPDDWQDALQKLEILLEQESLRQELLEKSKHQLKKYVLDATKTQMLECLRHAKLLTDVS